MNNCSNSLYNNVTIFLTPFYVQACINLLIGWLLMEGIDTDGAAPVAFRGGLHRWLETVHVIASVAVVAKQQLVVVLGSTTQSAGLALDALPRVLLHRHLHVLRELEASGVT